MTRPNWSATASARPAPSPTCWRTASRPAGRHAAGGGAVSPGARRKGGGQLHGRDRFAASMRALQERMPFQPSSPPAPKAPGWPGDRAVASRGHGGDIAIVSPGRGTTFTSSCRSRADSRTDGTRHERKLDILVVEDDAALRDAVCLRSRWRARPRVGVGDRRRCGIETQPSTWCAHRSAHAAHGRAGGAGHDPQSPAATPVLLMTAYGDVDKAVAAMRGGACDFLMKPFEPEGPAGAHALRRSSPEGE